MDIAQLLRQVEEAFALTGTDTPPWPDPHSAMVSPREEEYSRCLDPGRYRILAARAEAWSRALVDLDLATREEDPQVDWRAGGGPHPSVVITKAFRLRPSASDALSVVFSLAALDGIADAVTHLGVGDPTAVVLGAPDCGCDACDHGSEQLLTELDDHLVAVVTGRFVRVSTGEQTVVATHAGWSGDGPGGFEAAERLLDDARAGRSRHDVLTGPAWW